MYSDAVVPLVSDSSKVTKIELINETLNVKGTRLRRCSLESVLHAHQAMYSCQLLELYQI